MNTCESLTPTGLSHLKMKVNTISHYCWKQGCQFFGGSLQNLIHSFFV